MGAVRGDRQVEGFGEASDLHGDAAAVGDVGFEGAAGGDELLQSSCGGRPTRPAGSAATRRGRPRRRGSRASSQVRSALRAARIAWSAAHFMLASAMSGKPSPRCAHGAHALDVLEEAGAADSS